MKRFTWPLLLLAFAASCSNGFWSNCLGGGGGGSCCGATATVSRETIYQGSIASMDGGTPTAVTLRVASTGATRITFTRDGVEVLEQYDAVAAPRSP